jgi:hypothetical protein
VSVPYATLHRFAVAELGFGRRAATVPIADCDPGTELQVDTGWMSSLEPDAFGKRRRFRAWIFTAVYSRHRFVWPCLPETTASAIEACEQAWQFFGGVFRVLLRDNTKAIVTQADPLDARLNETSSSTHRRAASWSIRRAFATRATRAGSSARCPMCAMTASRAKRCTPSTTPANSPSGGVASTDYVVTRARNNCHSNVPYIPNDVPALTLSVEWYSKAWWPRIKIDEFVADYGALSQRQIVALFEEAFDAVMAGVDAARQYGRDIAGFADLAETIATLWMARVESFRAEPSGLKKLRPRNKV